MVGGIEGEGAVSEKTNVSFVRVAPAEERDDGAGAGREGAGTEEVSDTDKVVEELREASGAFVCCCVS